MDLKTLKTFQLIVKHGSFNRAAQEMNYVQSTVTMQIQKLEAELGVKLIERGKDLSLTEAGRMFYDQSVQIVKNMEQLQTNISDLRSGEAGNVRIGVTEPSASYRFPSILKNFMDKFPNINISLEILNTATLSKRVLKGELDFALTTAPGLESDLYFEPVFEEEFVVLIPENHPLAEKMEIELKDFQGHRLLFTSTVCPYRRKLEMVVQEQGNLQQLHTMEIGSMTALKHYVEHGLGIALVPKVIVDPVPPGTVVRNITGSLVHMTMGILCKESAYPFQLASQRLYSYLKQELSS